MGRDGELAVTGSKLVGRGAAETERGRTAHKRLDGVGGTGQEGGVGQEAERCGRAEREG